MGNSNQRGLPQALLIAPLVPALFIFIYQCFIFDFRMALTGSALLLLTDGYFSALILGIPVHIFLKKKFKQGLYPYIFCGFGIGLIMGLLPFGDRFYLFLRFGIIGMIYGAISAAIFWFIAVKKTSYGGSIVGRG
jgi:hypothetical protein